MLKYLQIKNVALVDELKLTFSPGLNVITGETGAGKSILIGSIALTLGDRAHPDVVKDASAQVWATFDGSNGARLLHREVRPDGRTKAQIDDQSATIGALKEEGARWVELTAQRDGINLLDPETHLQHVDRFAALTAKVEKLAAHYARHQALQNELKALDAKLRRLRETEELANYQLEEIDSFDPRPGEDEELEQEIRLLEGAESLLQGLSEAVDELDQGEEPVSDRLAAVRAAVQDLARIDDSLKDQVESLSEALDVIRQSALDLSNRRDEIQLDPERLEEVRTRHGQLIRLIRKYGGSMQSLLDEREQLRSRETSTDELVQQRRQLLKDIDSHLAEWESECESASEKRRLIIPKMQEAMEQGLRTVGVERPRFVIHSMPEEGIEVGFPRTGQHKVGPAGWDRYEFRISFNPGHEPKALQRVASGGELSRMMLLLRGLAPPDGLAPVLVFDEVDTGISGKTARQVGLRLKELAQRQQVILVTHLPQIASLADRHIIVEKRTSKDETNVEMREVEIGSKEQVEEIARLVGGEKITDATRNAAKELIDTASRGELRLTS